MSCPLAWVVKLLPKIYLIHQRPILINIVETFPQIFGGSITPFAHWIISYPPMPRISALTISSFSSNQPSAIPSGLWPFPFKVLTHRSFTKITWIFTFLIAKCLPSSLGISNFVLFDILSKPTQNNKIKHQIKQTNQRTKCSDSTCWGPQTLRVHTQRNTSNTKNPRSPTSQSRLIKHR